MLDKIFNSLNKINKTISTAEMVQGTATRAQNQAGRLFSGRRSKWILIAVVVFVVLYLIFG